MRIINNDLNMKKLVIYKVVLIVLIVVILFGAGVYLISKSTYEKSARKAVQVAKTYMLDKYGKNVYVTTEPYSFWHDFITDSISLRAHFENDRLFFPIIYYTSSNDTCPNTFWDTYDTVFNDAKSSIDAGKYPVLSTFDPKKEYPW